MRPSDQKTVSYSSPEEGAHHVLQGHKGKLQGVSLGRGNKGKTWARSFIVVSAGRNG